MNRKALLIIDMQKGSFVPEMPRYNANQTFARINKLSSCFRKFDLPVVHIQHDGTAQNIFHPHSHDWEIIDEIKVEKSDIRINKYINNSFYKSNLLETLQDLDVDELVITGCASDFCVNATIIGALDHEFILTIAKDGHTTTDRPHADAEQIFNHYNYVWENMTPTKGEITVINTSSIIKEIIHSQ